MPDWKSRLAVYVNDGDEALTPIESFSPTFAVNAEPLHSIEQTHIGVVYTPDATTFSMTVRAIGPGAGRLTALAMRGERFKIALEFAGPGDQNDWSFDSIVLEDCVITNATPSPATISGAPMAQFSGMSLSAGVTTVEGEEAALP